MPHFAIDPIKELGKSKDWSAGARRLGAARVFGSAVLADLALLATNMPTGYLGPARQLSQAGAQFMAVQLVLTLLAIVRILKGLPLGRRLALSAITLNLVFFIWPMFEDPVPAGFLVVWQLAVLFGVARGPRKVSAPGAGTGASGGAGLYGPALRHLLTVSIVVWIFAQGYRLATQPLVLGLCLLVAAVALVASRPLLVELWRSAGIWKLLLPVILLGSGAALLALHGPLWLLIAVFEGVVLLLLLARMPIHAEISETFTRRPPALIAGTFASLIALGTVLLSFPAASAGVDSLSPVDALFTAASAVCVTGLTVVDTATQLSFFGQFVVLALIQTGGFGILVLSGFAAALLGEGLGLRGERALGESLDLSAGTTTRLVTFIVVSTLALEGVGAVILAFAFKGPGISVAKAAWLGLFHSVSAFCNAGFSLWSDSLVPFRSDPVVLLSIAALITLGGLGFPVLATGWARLRHRRHRFSTHSRLVLMVSAGLTVLGGLGYAVGEWNHSLDGLSSGDKVLGALFQSVTLRTAGFTVTDLSAPAPITFLWMLVLMLIGASPGGTGGGIKTTTAAVLATAVPAAVRGSGRAVLFGRTVPLETVYKAASVMVMTLGTALVILTALLLSQPLPFEQLLFETVSALGTVGLSMGTTPLLDSFGKLCISAAMFVGRIGPLTLALLLGRRTAGRLRYPEAQIMVG